MVTKRPTVLIGILIGIIGILVGVIASKELNTSQVTIAPSNPAQTSPTSTSITLPQTIIKTWTPITPSGQPSANLNISQVISGSCFGGSVAVNDPSAWRCTVGNNIEDPCWAFSGSPIAICTPDPWSPAIEIQLTQPLPSAYSNTGNTSNSNWALQLANGVKCVVSTGTVNTYFGIRLDYACNNGGYSGNLGSRGSTTFVKYVVPNATTLKTESVAVIWSD